MFLREDRSEIVGVDASVVLIPLFGIDIPASSEGIRFCAKLSGAETNDHVELGEELRPVGLPPGGLRAVFGDVSSKTAEHTKLVIETVLPLHSSKLAVLS